MNVSVRQPGSSPPTKGNFAATLANGTLSLPAIFGELVRKTNVQSAADFISVVDANPETVARALGWPTADVVTALRQLALTVGQASGVDYLSALDAPVRSRAMGARKPTTSKPPPVGKTG
jgi:hypothetical protein